MSDYPSQETVNDVHRRRRWAEFLRRRWTSPKVSRAIGWLVLTMLVPVLVLLIGIYGVWYATSMTETREANLELARAVAAAFDASVQDLHRQQHTLERALGMLKGAPPAEINRLLAASAEQYRALRAIHWVDDRGVVIASSDPNSVGSSVASYEFYKRLEGGEDLVASDLMPSWITGRPIFIVGKRIKDLSGGSTGMLLSVVYPDVFGQQVLSIRLDPADFISLFDSMGTVVFSNQPSRMGMTWTARQDPALQEALAGREAQGRVISPDTGQHRLVARVPIPSTGWAAGASVALSAVASPLLRSILMATAVLAVVTALCVLVVLQISRRIVVPLYKLREHAHRIGEGHLERHEPIRGPLELQELGAALNGMSEQLAAARTALEQANEDLRRSNRDLEQFAYIASHDLQEPLRAVGGFVTLLQQRYRGSLDEKADRYIGEIVDGVSRMQALINGLLEYSRVGMRGGDLQSAPAGAALDEALANLRASIEQSGAVVTSEPLPTVCADPAQLTRLFQNLVGNAIKFRSEQPPQVHVGAEHRDHEWLFSVRDNGIGIDPQYADRIFMIFQRLHTRDKYPGTGIGLAVCKRIVERHGGRIWVESQPGQGSTFYFSVPDQGERP